MPNGRHSRRLDKKIRLNELSQREESTDKIDDGARFADDPGQIEVLILKRLSQLIRLLGFVPSSG